MNANGSGYSNNQMIEEEKEMKKVLCALLLVCLMTISASADDWVVPRNGVPSSGSYYDDYAFYGISAKLVEDLATRSGPSTTYTGCGSYQMKGETVTVYSRKYDNGGVLWVEVEFTYGGGYRRAWTGAKRLNLSESQLASLPEEDGSFLGYGTVLSRITPRYGPGTLYSTHNEAILNRGDQVAVIREQNGFYLTECYINNSNEKLRSWISVDEMMLN